MKKRILAVIGISALVIAVAAAAPLAYTGSPTGAPVVSIDTAQAQKGGDGSASRVGERTASLVQSILVPVMIVLIGAFALVALAKREVGMAVSVIAIGLIAGLFLLAPEQVESTFKSIYSSIFA